MKEVTQGKMHLSRSLIKCIIVLLRLGSRNLNNNIVSLLSNAINLQSAHAK